VSGTSRVIFGDALNANSGYTHISSPVTFGAGSTTTVAAGARLNISGSTIHNGGSITGAGYYNPPASNTVAANSTISTTDFNFDLGSWTVQPGAHLTVNVGDYDPDAATNGYDNSLTLNTGSISVSTGDPKFVMDGVLNMNTTAGNFAYWNGETFQLGNDADTLDADLNVTGAGFSQIVDIDFMSDADVFIGSGAKLQVLGTARFNSVNGANSAEFTGTGKLETHGEVYFDEATTLNMTGGTVDLDGFDAIGSVIHVSAPVVINAATLESFGKTNQSGTNILDINHSTATGSLTVNLDNPTAEWTLNVPGALWLTNAPAATAATLLAGSAVNLDGTVMVTGDVRTDARVDIAGSVDILTAGKPFRLSGGDLTQTNTLVGGRIYGPGFLAADSGSGLVGYGTIEANIDFKGTADLLAENGTLTVNGSILDLRYVGTNAATGILNVVNAWSSAPFDRVLMKGGELRGGTLTIANSAGMSGHGRVTAKVINDTRITANTSADPLILHTAANDNDWDGTANTGMLQATGGTLELLDTSGFAFNGTVSATSGGTVNASGFELSMESSSTLNLSGGTFKQSNGITTDLFGTITVGAGTSSLLGAGTGGFRFNATSVTALTGNLQLDCPVATIRADATFTGTGALKILSGCFVSADGGANVNVLTDNAGDFIVSGSGPTGRVDVKDYQQSAGGDLQLDLRGTALANYDRLLVGGTAQIAGDLELALGGGYIPVLGDTFSVLSATAGVIGTFNPLVQPTGMPAGLAFEVVYSPTLVQLKVVAAGSIDTWINTFGIANPADRTRAANPDHDSLNNLGEFATDGNPVNGASTGKIVGKIAPVGGSPTLTLTLPLRNGTVPDPADPAGGELGLIQAADGLKYRIQATDALGGWPLTVTEVTGADAAAIRLGLPGLNSGWTYRTFRSPGPVAGGSGEFMRVEISE
jgi:hypothetical protein